MGAVIEWLFTHVESIGVVGVVLISNGAFVAGWWREDVILGKTHRKILDMKDAELSNARKDCAAERERSERLMDKLERTVTVAELVAKRG